MQFWNTATGFVAAWLMMMTLSVVEAVLPPGAVDALKMNSSEVLMVQVDFVTVLSDNETDAVVDNCTTYYNVDATVRGINDTMMDLSMGDPIEFESYYYDRSLEGCETFAGPSSPPMMTVGWCGYIFLNPGVNGTFVPSAYGDSFIELIDGECLVAQIEVPVEDEDSQDPGPDDGTTTDASGDGTTSGEDTTTGSAATNGDGTTPETGTDGAPTSNSIAQMSCGVAILGSALAMLI